MPVWGQPGRAGPAAQDGGNAASAGGEGDALGVRARDEDRAGRGRGVARLQHSYLKLDVLLERWKETLARLEDGELASYPERHAALVTPLGEAEGSARLAMRGGELVAYLRDFAWEQGPPAW